MIIKFKNGSSIEALDITNNAVFGRREKSFDQMKWILGEVYKSLKWY